MTFNLIDFNHNDCQIPNDFLIPLTFIGWHSVKLGSQLGRTSPSCGLMALFYLIGYDLLLTLVLISKY